MDNSKSNKKWDRECPQNKLTGQWVYFDKNGKPNQIKVVPPDNSKKKKY